ncbi:MAG: transcription termination/antitermination protein NusA, partial [Candidatus Pacebacteria bacterium]|nr:transcription termination/antitermination protein NusA [Candidatus Paceibacterota bacterium]
MIEELKNFTLALSQISEEKGLSLEKIIEVVEIALSAAYKKDFGKKGEVIKAKLNPQNGDIKFWQVLFVVDESMIYSEEELAEMSEQETEYEMEKEEELEEGKKLRFNPKKHIMIEEAKKIDPKISIGQELIIPLESKQEYGRIAAQTAKQVILQKLKEVERENIYQEFQSKIEEITSGIVQRIEGKNVFLNIGKTLGIMPPKEQIPQEYYKPGQRLKVLIREVQESPQGPMIILSRSYPKLVTKLFEIEVPEVSSGQVEIKAISREAGSRTKIAVFSNQEGIDPIGAMVGQR